MRAALCIVCSLVGLLWAATALAAHSSARAGASPASWVTATCSAISSLQHGVDGRWGGTTAVRSRAALLARLDRDAADANAVVTATTRAPAGVPNGTAIAAALRGPAVTLRTYVASARALAKHGNVAAVALAARARMQQGSDATGAAFVHVEGLYPSSALRSAIDQAPSCALVHG